MEQILEEPCGVCCHRCAFLLQLWVSRLVDKLCGCLCTAYVCQLQLGLLMTSWVTCLLQWWLQLLYAPGMAAILLPTGTGAEHREQQPADPDTLPGL